MTRINSAKCAYRMARHFGRGRCVSLWLAARMMATGRTGVYRITWAGQGRAGQGRPARRGRTG